MTAAPGAPRGRRLTPSVVAVCSVVLAGVGITLATARPTVENLVQGHLIGDAAATVAAALVGAVILVRIPHQPVGRLFAAVGVADGVALLASGLQSAQPDNAIALWAAAWTWQPGLGLLVGVLPLVVPDGVHGRFERWLLGVCLGAIAAWTIGSATSARLASGPGTSVPNPVALPAGDAVATGSVMLCVVVTVAAVVVLIRRLLLTAEQRRRLLPLLAAWAVVLVCIGVAPALGLVGVVLQDIAVLLVPVACLVAVLRFRLYDLEVAIGRSVVWIVLAGVLVAGDVLVVQAAGRLLRVPGLPASVLATAAVAFAFAPLRLALQRVVNRWLYGARGDPAAALQATTGALAGGAEPRAALERAVDELGRVLRCPGARVLRSGRLLTGRTDGAAALSVPLRLGALEVGRLEVLSRSPGERYSSADERLLASLAPVLAPAVAAVTAQDDLSAARSRIAVAREEERRRVREQLHDDIGPSLAAVSMQAATASKRLARHDELGAAAALDVVRATVVRAGADLRSVVDALGPRALDELGLAAAVADLGSLIGGDLVAVDVQVAALPPLPAATEQAAYRIVAESLANVVRHSGARRAEVRIRVTAGPQLVIEVTDDGRATSLDRPGGVGIASMRARAEELGGTLRVVVGAGTVVTAQLPLAATVSSVAAAIAVTAAPDTAAERTVVDSTVEDAAIHRAIDTAETAEPAMRSTTHVVRSADDTR